MFNDIIAIIYLLKTFIYYGLYYSFKIGQSLVYVFGVLSTYLLKLLKELTNIFVIVFESFTIFCQDIFQGLQQATEICSQIWDTVDTGISTGLGSTNNIFQVITDSIFGGLSHISKSILNLGSLIAALCQLCKYTIILIGSGVWFTITLIPYSLLNLLTFVLNVVQSIPTTIINGSINTAKLMKDCIQNSYSFMTDVPVESVIGILIAICLTYLLTQFYFTIVLFLYTKSRRIFLYIVNKFIRLPRPQRNTRMPVHLGASISRRPQLRRSYRTSPVEVKNETNCEIFCIICQERLKCILVLPCRHVCMCSECNTRLQLYSNTCPVCRNDIESTMKIFV